MGRWLFLSAVSLAGAVHAQGSQGTVPPSDAAPPPQLRESIQLRASPGLRMHRLPDRSEEHTSELQSLMRISYAVFCLKKKRTKPSSEANDPTSRQHK